jgi:DNA-binding NtrC family response regulator
MHVLRIKLGDEEETSAKVAPEQAGPLAVPRVSAPAPLAEPPMSLHAFCAKAEAHAISRALEFVGWNRRRAAEMLRISYRGLLYKIRQYNITAASAEGVKTQPGMRPETVPSGLTEGFPEGFTPDEK